MMNISTIITELRRRAQRLGGETPGSDGELMLHAANNLEGFMLNLLPEAPPSLPLSLDDWDISHLNPASRGDTTEAILENIKGWWLVTVSGAVPVYARRRK